MRYLKCKECGGVYELKEGESPEDFDVCYCGGEIEYHLSRDELKERSEYVPSDEEIARRNTSNRNLILIIIVVASFIFIVPTAIAALLIYRAYFSTAYSGAIIAVEHAVTGLTIIFSGIP